jgi:hypothetical protein
MSSATAHNSFNVGEMRQQLARGSATAGAVPGRNSGVATSAGRVAPAWSSSWVRTRPFPRSMLHALFEAKPSFFVRSVVLVRRYHGPYRTAQPDSDALRHRRLRMAGTESHAPRGPAGRGPRPSRPRYRGYRGLYAGHTGAAKRLRAPGGRGPNRNHL